MTVCAIKKIISSKKKKAVAKIKGKIHGVRGAGWEEFPQGEETLTGWGVRESEVPWRRWHLERCVGKGPKL